MICTQCNVENSGSAKFCKNCGTPLSSSNNLTSSNNPWADRLIISGISISFVASCMQILIFNILRLPQESEWSSSNTSHFFQAIGILNLIGGILIPLALKNTLLKILGVLLILIPSLYYIFQS
jgi:hypothetical protein